MYSKKNIHRKTNILVVDNYPEFLNEVLEEYGFNTLIARNGIEAKELLEENLGNFDLIMLDIILPIMNGWDLLKFIREHSYYKQTPVIMTTSLNNEIDLVSSLRVGADDFITKPFNTQTLIARIEALMRRSLWTKNIIITDCPIKDKDILTDREKEIIKLLGEGDSNRQIADKLFLSELTVKTHLKNIFKKLNVSNRTQAVLTAMNKGIIV